MKALLALSLLAAVAPPGDPIPQDPPAATGERGRTRDESEVERLLRAAIQGRSVVRPQAASRLVQWFREAGETDRAVLLERLRRDAGDGPSHLARLGPALIEVLGAFEDGALRERLWRAIDEPDFPWRPYAVRSVAESALPEEAARFEELLEDPIAPVRAAAIAALGRLERRSAIDAIAARLSDEDDRVRRAAAEQLVAWGRPSALWWLVEEYRRSDSFFDRPTGEQARFAAAKGLSRLIGGDLALHPERPQDAATELGHLAELVRARAGERPEIAEIARAGEPLAGERLGLELRSCRRGEFFLRWTRSDELLVGQGRPVRVALAPGTVDGLAEAAEEAARATPERFFGAPGCDLEQLHLVDASGALRTWIVSKGPEPIEGLRPASLGELFGRLLASVPDEAHSDPRLDRLRSRCRAALLAIGGE